MQTTNKKATEDFLNIVDLLSKPGPAQFRPENGLSLSCGVKHHSAGYSQTRKSCILLLIYSLCLCPLLFQSYLFLSPAENIEVWKHFILCFSKTFVSVLFNVMRAFPLLVHKATLHVFFHVLVIVASIKSTISRQGWRGSYSAKTWHTFSTPASTPLATKPNIFAPKSEPLTHRLLSGSSPL